MEDLRSKVTSSQQEGTSEDPTFHYVETPVDFVELKRINPDTYAWINIPGTVIDYPILCSQTSFDYYLNHSPTGEVARYGSIFTDYYNSTDFSDFNTVIYGHNTVDGTMFGTLRKYKNQSYVQKNKFINIYMPGRILKYEIFAVYIWDDRHILCAYDFNNMEERTAYLKMISEKQGINRYYDSDLSVTENDRIITLSTCTASGTKRFLVQGVLISDSSGQFTRGSAE